MDYRAAPPDAPLFVVSDHVTALDRATGRQLWSYPLMGVVRRYAFDGPRVFVFENSGALHCLDLATGKLLGKVDTKLKEANNMLIDGDRIYLAAEREAVALDLAGNILWKVPIPVNGSSSLCGLGIPGGPVTQPDFSVRG